MFVLLIVGVFYKASKTDETWIMYKRTVMHSNKMHIFCKIV